MQRATALLVGVALALSSCAGEDVSASEMSLSDLEGSWENGTLVLQVAGSGEYRVVAPGTGEVEALMGGFIARDGDRFNFVTGVFENCPGQTGVYEGSLEDDVLTLTLVDDPCAFRVSGFEDAFTRTG